MLQLVCVQFNSLNCLLSHFKYYSDEQSDAAYADLINTTMQQRGIDNLSTEEMERLDKGGTMYAVYHSFNSTHSLTYLYERWEKEAKTTVNKLGLFGDIMNALKALSGGAHIEKNKFGET